MTFQRLFKSPAVEWLKAHAGAYIFAASCVGVATVVRLLLDPLLGNEHALIPYYGALAITAWRRGWWPALFSLVLGWLAADWLFLAPRHEISVLSLQPTQLLGCGTFVGTGLIIAALSEAAKRAQRRAESHADIAEKRGRTLEDEILERNRTERALRENQDRLQQALEAARMVSWEWFARTDECVLSTNASAVIGVGPPFRMDHSEGLVVCIHPDDLQTHQERVARALAEGGSYVSQFRYIRPDNGVTIWLEDHAHVISDASGAPVGIRGIVMDITQRKKSEQLIEQSRTELEARVQERTAQLKAANQELEAFSYSVSHDLRAPLRGINSFAQLLKDDAGGRLSPGEQEMLEFVINSAHHMDELIQDLLSLARVSRSELRRRDVDLSELAWAIAAELRKAEPRRAAEFTIQPGLSAEGDDRLLRVALENLLSNAWKFSGNRALSHIEFGREQREGEWVYFVRDNGAGFDMANANKLFGTFQRLHSETEFPGTGIGLATVERIIRRHGGRIWAQAAVNEGATFYFTLG